MSKRGPGANFGGDEDRFGGPAPGNEVMDKPMKATDAQMARRKIALAKGKVRPGAASRQASPFTPASFTMANGNGNGNGNGNVNGNGNGSASPFHFGASQSTSFNFGASQAIAPSNPFANFGQTQPADNSRGSTPAANPFAGFGQSQPAPTNTASFGGFNQTQTAPAGSTPSFTGFPPTNTASFTGFGSQPSTVASSSSSNMFGQSQPSSTTTTSFTFGQSPAAPAPAPSTTSSNIFGQANTATANASSSNIFGQTAPSTANAPSSNVFGQAAPSTANASSSNIFGQAAPSTASAPSSNIFGQTAPSTASAPSSNIFGQTAPSTANASSSNIFGQTAPPTASSTSSSNMFAQSNLVPTWTPPDSSRANTPVATTQAETSKPNLFSNLSQTQSASDKPTSMFAGLGQSQQNGASTSAVTSSLPPSDPAKTALFTNIGTNTQSDSTKASNPFANFGQTQSDNSRSSTPFATKQPEQDKPSNLFAGIGQQPPQNGTSTPLEKASNPFGSLGQANADPAKMTLFTNLGQMQSDTSRSSTPFAAKQPEAPKANDLFAGFSQKPQQNNGSMQVNGEKKGLFGASIADPPPTSGTGSIFDSIAKKAPSNFVFSSSDPKQVYREEEGDDDDAVEDESASKTPKAAPSRSLFDRIEKVSDAEGAETPKAAASSSLSSSQSIFSQANGSSKALTASSKPSFTSDTPKAAPSQSIFSQANGSRKTFGPQTTFTSDPSKAASATRTLTAPTAQQSPTAQPSTAYAHPPLSDLKKASALKNLNEGIIAHLKTQDPTVDLSAIYRFALFTSASISGAAPPSDLPLAASQPPAPPSGNDRSSVFSSAAAQASPSINGSSAPGSTSMFSQSSNSSSGGPFSSNTATPKASSSRLFSKPPSTAPPGNKRILDADVDSPAQPATEKRAKTTDFTSPMKKRQPDQDDEGSAQPSTDKRAKASYPALPDTASQTTRLFAATLDKSDSANAGQSGGFSGFKPAAASPSGFTPAASTTSPTKTATSSSQAGGLKMPTFTAATTGSSNFLSSFGAAAKKNEEKERQKRMDEDYDSDEGSREEWEKKDREEQEKKRQAILDAAKSARGFKIPTAALTEVAATAPTMAEKSQGPGNNTWSAASPIKFSSETPSATPAAPPPSVNLFGSLKNTTTTTPAPPATGNLFTSLKQTPATSTASGSLFSPFPTATPAVVSQSTGEAGDTDEDGEEDTSTPRDDLAGLLPSELKENTVLKELFDTKTSKFEETDQVGEDGKKTKKWVSKASGRLFVLKSKQDNKIRILCKAPQGQVLLNYNALKGGQYAVAGKKGTMVQGMFMDHIHGKEVGKAEMGRFIVTTANAEDAKELGKFLMQGSAASQ